MGATQKIQSYRDLEVWREAMKLAEVCYEATAAFPARETYGLASQIRRAAVSVASNIAEGHSRRTLQAYLNHLSIALGSQSELETQIELSRRLKLVSEALAKEILVKAEQVGRMLHALMRSLEHRKPDNPNT
jgi:four helix bundle protein